MKSYTTAKEVYDWAVAYLEQAQRTDTADSKRELQKLRHKSCEVQATLDALLLKAAQADDALAESFMCLARQKQEELVLLESRIEQAKAG